MSRSRHNARRHLGQSLTECLLLVIGVALFALMGFSVLNAGIGTQSASMAGALAGSTAKAEVPFNDALASSDIALVDFDSAAVTRGPPSANPGEDGTYAFAQGVAAGLIDNLVTELNALLSPVDTALALAELGRLLASDLVGTVELLYNELIASQIDKLVNGTDYERGFVLGNQVSALKAISVLAKASGATALVGAAKRADDADGNSRKVYRALSDRDDPAKGLTARNPLAKALPKQHVNGKKDSQFISTSTDLNVVTNPKKYNRSGNGIVEIDLDKVDGKIIDVSEGIPDATPKVNAFARKDKEVLIEGRIPPEAIRVIEKPK